jgi:hypothetical protein
MRPLVLAALLPLVTTALTVVAAPTQAAAEICDGRAATLVVPDTGYETAAVIGTPGDDVIVGTVRTSSRSLAVTLRGARGDDTLRGSRRADLLDGGPGRDRLNGRQGRDRCTTGERLASCEVRR